MSAEQQVPKRSLLRELLASLLGLLVLTVALVTVMFVSDYVREHFSEDLGDLLERALPSGVVLIVLFGEIGAYLRYHFRALPRAGGLILEIPYARRIRYFFLGGTGLMLGLAALALLLVEQGSAQLAILCLFTALFGLHTYWSPLQLRENGILTAGGKLILWEQVESHTWKEDWLRIVYSRRRRWLAHRLHGSEDVMRYQVAQACRAAAEDVLDRRARRASQPSGGPE